MLKFKRQEGRSLELMLKTSLKQHSKCRYTSDKEPDIMCEGVDEWDQGE